MSLINEALKRARQESRRREALAKGLPLAPPSHAAPQRSWLTTAIVAMALALVVSLFTIARLATNEPTASADVALSADKVDTHEGEAESAESTLPEARVEPTTSRVQDAEPRENEPQPQIEIENSVQSTSLPVAPPPVSTGLASPPTEGVRLAPDTKTRDVNATPEGLSAQPRVFVGRATLASGDTLELGGIAWSETGPYALLDERVIGLGESIMGYMVTRIAPQEVELEGSDGAILIRLK